VSSSGLVDSAYTHTFTPADLSALSLAVQVGRPDITGTVQPFSYTGVVINGWDLSCKAGDIPILKFDLLGQNEVTSQALSTATYPAGLVPMTFVQGVLNVGGSALDVMDVDVKGTNGLGGDRYFINGGALRKQPLENAQREYTGTFTCDFSGLTAYNRFTGGTEAALTLTFTGGLIGVSSHYTLQITGNVRFDGSTPNVKDMSTLDLQAPFKFVASGAADSSAISVLLTTTEVTP
jgi:hypothetical protein